jgi:Transposase
MGLEGEPAGSVALPQPRGGGDSVALVVRVGRSRPLEARPRGGADDQVPCHLPNVLTYFRHRITNAMTEGIASKIQALKKAANGFRNRDHFKTAIYFHCGGLDLYPDATH